MKTRFQLEPARRRIAIVFALSLAVVTSLAAGQAKAPTKKAVFTKSAKAAFITGVSVVPATITFAATDPDLGLVAGSSSSTASFTLWFGSASNWTLAVSSATAAFTGCTPVVPASAVTATCTATTAGGGASAACAAPGALSTAGITVASGAQPGFAGAITVTITFTLSDSWKYIAQTSPTCPLNLTYTVNAP